MAAPICVIAPFPELADLARQVAEEMALDVTISLGRLHDGLDAAREATDHGTEVLISRGGTALLLSRHLTCPVVDIEVGLNDVLRCLTALPSGFRGKIALVRFEHLFEDVCQLGRTLNLEVTTLAVPDRSTLRAVLAEAMVDGVQAVIGGIDAVRHAHDLGLHGLLLTSGRDAIRAALREASFRRCFAAWPIKVTNAPGLIPGAFDVH